MKNICKFISKMNHTKKKSKFKNLIDNYEYVIEKRTQEREKGYLKDYLILSFF